MLSESEATIRADEEKLFALNEKYSADTMIDDVEANDVHDRYRSLGSRTTIDLKNVTLRAPGSDDVIQVSAMRVRADSISAWWPLEAQEGVQINYLPVPPTQ